MKKTLMLGVIGLIGITWGALPPSLTLDIQQAESKKDLIYKFCDRVFKEGKTEVKDYKLDPAYSLFLLNLCKWWEFPEGKFKSKQISKNKFEFTDPNCLKDGELQNECPLAQETSQLFKDLMDEYFNLKEINILGVGDKDTRKSIEKFSKKYFPSSCDQQWSFFLNNEGEGLCYHPTTYKFLKEIIETLKENVDKTYYIDGFKLYKSSEEFYSKGFSEADAQFSDADGFRNIAWNEIYFYLLWIESYKQAMLNNEKVLPFLPPGGVKKRGSVAQQEIAIANAQVAYSIDALKKAFDMLRQIQKTFPMHVGLKVYMEDIKKVNKSLAKAYTPLHQLYYKIRYVQNIER